MKRIVTNVFVCVMLSGCTFNQYGPSVVIKEKDLSLSQSINLEQVKEVGEGSVTAAPIVSGKTQAQPQPAAKRVRSADCVPMPELKDPPKISLDELKKNMNSESALSEIFKNNHAQLYDGWKSMKKELEQWKKNPNRC